MSKHLVALLDRPASQTTKMSRPASRANVTVPTRIWFERVSIGLMPLQTGGGRASAWPVKIFLNPRMVQGEQFFNRPDRDYLLIGQHRYPIANCPQGIEVVGNEENRQLQLFLQTLD